MKRILIVASAVLAVAVVAALGVAAVRPAWLPGWARRDLPPPANDAGLYCDEHGVPEKFCTLCHEELKSSLLLCKEHGDIPEDICTLCHPEVAAKYRIKTCKEHGLPAHFCNKCGKGPSASAAQPDDGWCATHGKPEALCAECAGEAPEDKTPAGKACRQPLPMVRLASAALARQVGIEDAAAVEETHVHELSANAETAYDANHFAEISPRVGGFLRDVRADLGQVVHTGETLAVVDSAEVSAAKAQYLASQATSRLTRAAYDRTSSLVRSGSVPSKNELEALTALNQAQANLMDAEQKLRNLGFDDAELERIVKEKDTRNLLNVVAPIGGSVVLRHAVKGEAVQSSTRLFAVADISKMWLWIDVYESDIAKVKPGQAVSFVISGSDPEGPGLASLGEVTWVGSEVNDRTRTTRVRAELGNPSARLRANQFGQAQIKIGSEHKAIVVPKSAVQRKDKTEVVFLPQPDGASFRPQRVVTRTTDRDDVVEVTWGLQAGQRVVTRGSFLLKTEIMKGSIGAGCCD